MDNFSRPSRRYCEQDDLQDGGDGPVVRGEAAADRQSGIAT